MKSLTSYILKKQFIAQKLIKYVDDRPGHDFRYAIDSSKIKQDLGWEPKYNFRDGLRSTVLWYLENQDWWRKLK